jgi:hypothetical protein
VGIAPTSGGISKGLVERGGSLPGFPRFPQPRHFHGSFALAFSGGDECRRRLLDRVAFQAFPRRRWMLSFIATAEHQAAGDRGAPFLYPSL